MDDWSTMFIFIILDKQGRKRKKKIMSNGKNRIELNSWIWFIKINKKKKTLKDLVCEQPKGGSVETASLKLDWRFTHFSSQSPVFL